MFCDVTEDLLKKQAKNKKSFWSKEKAAINKDAEDDDPQGTVLLGPVPFLSKSLLMPIWVLDAAVVKFAETRGQTRWKYTNSLKGGREFAKDIEAASDEVSRTWVPPVTN